MWIVCHSTGTLTTVPGQHYWQYTYTFCKRDPLILAVNGNFSALKIQNIFSPAWEGEGSCDCLYGLVKVVMHDSHVQYVSLLVLKILSRRSLLSAQRWGCWWENKAPCPADTRQTDIRWSLVLRLGGPLGRTAVSRAEDRAREAPGLQKQKTRANKQSEPHCSGCLFIF